MALLDEVKSRYSTQFLANLTNPNDPDPSTVTDAKITVAVTDVEGDFILELGREFSLARKEDVVVGVEGVLAKLMERTGQAGEVARERHEKYLDRLKRLRVIPAPTSSSLRQRTSELEGFTSPRRPTFDEREFRDFVPREAGWKEDVP